MSRLKDSLEIQLCPHESNHHYQLHGRH